MIFYIIGLIVITGFILLQDWLIYKNRGHAQPNNSDKTNFPIITNSEDAHAQKLADFYKKDEKK